jgi:Helix-turn-helix domain
MRFNATTQEAAEILRTSESTLRRLRRAGVLRPGIHFCASGAGAISPPLLWAPEACEQALAKRSRQILTA